MIEVIVAADAAFIATNIDDILLLTLFFATAKPKQGKNVVIGHLLGLAVLTALSLLGAWGAGLFSEKFTALLGILPLLLGIREFVCLSKEDESENISCQSLSVGNILLITVASGGDNVGIYIPLLAGLSRLDTLVTLIVFLLLGLLWCTLGYHITRLPLLKTIIEKYGKYITPPVLILLGIYILISGLH